MGRVIALGAVSVTQAIHDAPRVGAYSSPTIRARRRRILKEAGRLIAERGLAGFNMEEVALRAGVAKRTLYNIFRGKEHVMAAAIQQSFQDYAARLPAFPLESGIDDVLERLAIVIRRSIVGRRYAQALMAIYHSVDVDPGIWREIDEIAALTHRAWVETLRRRRQLKAWTDAGRVVDDLSRVIYSVGNVWAQSRIVDEAFEYEVLSAFLTYAAGATRGTALLDVDGRLRELAAGRLVVAGALVPVPAKIREPAG